MGILSLEKRVGKERLINACSRALEYNLYNYKIVQSILEKNLDRLNGSSENDKNLPDHHNIRGSKYYE
jgi:hypothetical protein